MLLFLLGISQQLIIGIVIGVVATFLCLCITGGGTIFIILWNRRQTPIAFRAHIPGHQQHLPNVASYLV